MHRFRYASSPLLHAEAAAVGVVQYRHVSCFDADCGSAGHEAISLIILPVDGIIRLTDFKVSLMMPQWFSKFRLLVNHLTRLLTGHGA